MQEWQQITVYCKHILLTHFIILIPNCHPKKDFHPIIESKTGKG